MKPSNSGQNGEEQRSEQRQRKENRNGMQAPVAASRRDVMEAENKAEDAKQKAAEAQRLTVEEIENLRQDLEDAKSEVAEMQEELNAAVDEVEEQLGTLFEETSPKSFGKSWSRDPVPEGMEKRKGESDSEE